MNPSDRVRIERKGMEMTDDVTDQDKAAAMPKVEAACAAAISWMIAAKMRTTIAVSISIAIMFAVVVTGEVAIVTPKSSSPPPQCKVSVVYLVDTSDKTISVIATDKNQVMATIPMERAPHRVAVTPDGTRAYVTNFYVYSGNVNGQVSVIDTITNSVLTNIPLVNAIGYLKVAISPDGTRVYVAHSLNTTHLNTLSTIDTVTNKVISIISFNVIPGISYNMVLNPDGTRIYLPSYGAGLAVIDVVNQLIIDIVPVGPPMFGIAITPDGTQIYLTPLHSPSGNNGVTVVNTITNQFKTFIPIPSNFSGDVAVSPDRRRAYVASYGIMSVVTVIDTATNLALEHIPIPMTTTSGVPAIAVSVDGTQVYVADGDHTVFVIDAATNKVMGDIILEISVPGPIAMTAAWIAC
jgi:YVTN family beta-propeller protein